MIKNLVALEKNIFRVVSTTLLASIIIYNIGKLLGIFEPKGWYVLLCFGISLLIVFLCEAFNKNKMITVLVSVVSVVLPIIIIGVEKVYTFIKTYTKWAMSISGWKAEWVERYQIIQIVWIVIFVYAIQLILEKHFKLKLIVAVVIVFILGYYMVSKSEIKYMGVVLDACYIAMVLVEWTEKGWKKERLRGTSIYMLWMMPFVAIYFVLMMRMPVSPKPYEWKYVKAAYSYIQEKITVWINDVFSQEDEYDLALSGFSEEGTIGDGVVDQPVEIMTLETNRKMQTNVYLTGKVFNSFEGLSWKANQEEGFKDRYIDTVETLYAAMKYDPGYLYNYAIKSKITICYKDLNTDYLFAPLKFSSVENQWEQIDFKLNDGSTFFQDNQKYGYSYNVYFYQVNADAELFYDFLNADVVYDEALWNKVLTDFKLSTDIELTYQDIKTNSEKNYQHYMDCPELSKEVLDYLDSITEDAESDIEVLRAIEKELASYTYTQTPGKFPEDVIDGSSFLDFFILESKQGYCTHYATAFTLLARAKGYPARYVQGYCVPMLGERTATVTSSMAHAWPEVYVENVGWIAFEPTPGYGEIRYTPWTTKRITNIDNYYGEDFYSEEEETIATPTDENYTDEKKEKSTSALKKIIKMTKRFVIILLVAICLVVVIVKLVGRIQYIRKSYKEKYYFKVNRNIKLLGNLGFPMNEKETLTEYENRVHESDKWNLSLRFIKDYEEVIYGDKAIDDEKLSAVDSEYRQILMIIKEKSKVKYYWYMF